MQGRRKKQYQSQHNERLTSGTTALPSSADKSYNCIDTENLGCSKGKRKGGARDDVYVMNPPNLSKADPLLIVRLPYDSIPPKRNAVFYSL